MKDVLLDEYKTRWSSSEKDDNEHGSTDDCHHSRKYWRLLLHIILLLINLSYHYLLFSIKRIYRLPVHMWYTCRVHNLPFLHSYRLFTLTIRITRQWTTANHNNNNSNKYVQYKASSIDYSTVREFLIGHAQKRLAEINGANDRVLTLVQPKAEILTLQHTYEVLNLIKMETAIIKLPLVCYPDALFAVVELKVNWTTAINIFDMC